MTVPPPVITMILKERVTFRTREQADEFADWLKDEGCKSRVSEVFSSSLEVLAKGTFDTIDNWCEYMSGQDEEKKEIYQLIKENNQNYIDVITMIIENRNTYGLLYTHDDLKASRSSVLARYYGLPDIEGNIRIPQYSSDIFKQEIFREFELTVIHAIIEDEGYVKENEEGYILATDKKPGDMITKTGVNMIADKPIPKYPGIEIIPGFLPEMQYEVSFSMPVYLNVDPQMLGDVLLELGISPDDIRQYLNNYTIKRNILTLLLKLVEKSGSVRNEELKDTFENFWETQTEEDGLKSKINISAVLLDKFTAELKRAGLISTKNNRMVPASEKSSRRR
ncbi:hypothetical protein [Methanoplanus limicola]|uniref:Uncharacterized protein n=1 Tax=Methanoplanus limicola DSM 2279 TaxID=937775 RepID=H1Z222_9EURY|nr:hypothetical protein [Methanoplanus limicola]EHQ36367.1 hypothetical protein Metlim_2311 [Methanoplanus limicola DSM 2279]